MQSKQSAPSLSRTSRRSNTNLLPTSSSSLPNTTVNMPHPVFAKAHSALITGGASGIGLAVAKLCANHGMKLAIVDHNKESLAFAKAAFAEGVDVETYETDVSKIDQWTDLKQKVEKRFGGINLLMLNAGTSGKPSWEDTDYFHKVGCAIRAPCGTSD
jgi:threonine dehydrogenase-like Zn-dependent dehydrogenase